MRTRLFLAFVLFATPLHADPEVPSAAPVPAPAPVRSGLDVLIDKAKVDLKEHRLEVRMNHVAAKVTIKVFDESGAVLADQEQEFAGRAPGSTLVVTWAPSS